MNNIIINELLHERLSENVLGGKKRGIDVMHAGI